MTHLVARPPMPGYARFRFVCTKSNWLSLLIRWRTMGEVSHVENVLPDGSIIGAYGDGVKQIPGDTDLGYTTQRFVDILMTQDSLEHVHYGDCVRRLGALTQADLDMNVKLLNQRMATNCKTGAR